MALYHVLGGQLLSDEEFQQKAPAIQAMVAQGAAHPGVPFSGGTISHDHVMSFSAPVQADGFVPTPLTPGGPLCVQIRHVYPGKFPKTPSWFSGEQSMLLTSALKDYATYAASSRAVNFLTRMEPHQARTTPKATEQGTPVIAYYPAVVSDSLTLTLDMVFDQFPEALTQKAGGTLSSISDLPIFLPAKGYLMLAGSLVSLAGDLANKLIDGQSVFSQTVNLNFNSANGPLTAADLRVVCNKTLSMSDFRYDWDQGLVSAKSGAPYDGDEPYIVLLIDGAQRLSLKDFAPTMATAATIQKFFNVQPGGEVVLDSTLQAMKLWNDFQFYNQAKQVDAELQAPGLTDPQKSALVQQFNAYGKNIQTDQFKLLAK